MPLYRWECRQGCYLESYLTVAAYSSTVQTCFTHGAVMEPVIGAPLLVKASPDVCYDSPIDGRPITSMQARLEDLARHNCAPYDPEQKTDYHRRIKDREAALDKAVDEQVEAAIEKMPTSQRGKLYSELTEQGADIQFVRSTKVP